MKPWTPLVLLPLLFSQGIATAQADLPSTSVPLTSPLTSPSLRPQPALIALKGTEQLQLQLVNCYPGLDCTLAGLLLPKSARIEQFQLQFDNPATDAVQVLNTAAIVQGEFTRYQLTDAFSIPATATLPANQVVSLPLRLNPAAMPPDQYSGSILLTLANQPNRLVLPVSLKVRGGPLLPLLVLFMGVVLGRLFKYMKEQGGPQAEALQEVYQLEVDLREAHPDDQRLLEPQVQMARRLVYRQQLEAAKTQVTTIRSRLDVLTQLRSIETQLTDQQNQDGTVPDEAFAHISQVRIDIDQGLDAKARETLNQVIDIVSILPTRRGDTDNSAKVTATLQGVATTLEYNARRLAIAPRPTTWVDLLQQALIDLSGLSEQVRAEATYWFVRPALYGLLLVGLTFMGLNTLYIENGETFGAKPSSDYFGLLLWGLSADVASRSVSGLQSQKD